MKTSLLKIATFTLPLFILLCMGTVASAGNTTNGFGYQATAPHCTITSYKGKKANVIIPAVIKFVPFRHSLNPSPEVTETFNVTGIADQAFNGSKFESVVLPDSITSIGNLAFSSCTNLTSIAIPAGITSIGNLAFDGCTALTSIDVDKNNMSYSSLSGVLYDKKQTSIIQYPATKKGAFTVPASVTSIGDSAFYDCTGLTSITIPEGVTTLGDNAFNGCTGLTSITIPASVTTIGRNAFFFCSALTSITIPASVTNIGTGAFYGCPGAPAKSK
jgi:hypothetical protein